MRQLVQAQKGALSFHYCRSPKKEDFQKLKETSLLLLLHYKFNFKTRLKWGMIQLCAQWARPANVQIMSTVHQQQCSADKTVEMFPQTKQKNADVQDHGAQLELDHRRDCGWQNAPWLATGFTILQLYRFCPFFVHISHISTFWSTQLFPALSSHFGEKTRKMLVLP